MCNLGCAHWSPFDSIIIYICIFYFIFYLKAGVIGQCLGNQNPKKVCTTGTESGTCEHSYAEEVLYLCIAPSTPPFEPLDIFLIRKRQISRFQILQKIVLFE